MPMCIYSNGTILFEEFAEWAFQNSTTLSQPHEDPPAKRHITSAGLNAKTYSGPMLGPGSPLPISRTYIRPHRDTHTNANASHSPAPGEEGLYSAELTAVRAMSPNSRALSPRMYHTNAVRDSLERIRAMSPKQPVSPERDLAKRTLRERLSRLRRDASPNDLMDL